MYTHSHISLPPRHTHTQTTIPSPSLWATVSPLLTSSCVAHKRGHGESNHTPSSTHVFVPPPKHQCSDTALLWMRTQHKEVVDSSVASAGGSDFPLCSVTDESLNCFWVGGLHQQLPLEPKRDSVGMLLSAVLQTVS